MSQPPRLTKNTCRRTPSRLEAAIIRGPFHAAAESHWLNADRIIGAEGSGFRTALATLDRRERTRGQQSVDELGLREAGVTTRDEDIRAIAEAVG